MAAYKYKGEDVPEVHKGDIIKVKGTNHIGRVLWVKPKSCWCCITPFLGSDTSGLFTFYEVEILYSHFINGVFTIKKDIQ